MTTTLHPDTADRADPTETVRRIWQDVLGLSRPVADDEDFFALGGHSMLATRLMSRIGAKLGTALAVDLIFTHSVFAEFLTALRASVDAGAEASVPVARGRASGPVSLQQEELLRVETALGPSPINNVVMAASMDGVGAGSDAVRPDVLRRALQAVVNRHPALRLGFRGGEQVIGPPLAVSEVDFEVVDGARDRAAVRAAVRLAHLRPFDLEHGTPLRAQLFRRPDGDLLVLHLHHLCVDGHSQSVLLDDLSAAYGAVEAGTAPRGPSDGAAYPDYAAWQRAGREDLTARSAEHWRKVVDDLALDRAPGGGRRAVRYVRETAAVPAEEMRAVRARVRAEGGTDFMALCAAAARGVARLSGRTRVGVGTLMANRSLPGFERAVGPFATSTLLALDVAGPAAPGDLIRAVRAQLTEARRWSHLPLEALLDRPCAELGLELGELVDVVVTLAEPYEPEPGGPLRLSPVLDDDKPLLNTVVGAPTTVSAFPEPDGALRLTAEVAEDGPVSGPALVAEVLRALREFAAEPDAEAAR